jgi:hypothetical protein
MAEPGFGVSGFWGVCSRSGADVCAVMARSSVRGRDAIARLIA